MNAIGEWADDPTDWKPDPDLPVVVDDAAADTAAPELQYGSVDEFVREMIVPVFRRKVAERNASRWDAEWWRYPEAVIRLEALWRAWEHLRLDPATGISVWLRDHADYHLGVLFSDEGPFGKSHETSDHGAPLPYSPPPPGLFPDVRVPSDEGVEPHCFARGSSLASTDRAGSTSPITTGGYTMHLMTAVTTTALGATLLFSPGSHLSVASASAGTQEPAFPSTSSMLVDGQGTQPESGIFGHQDLALPLLEEIAVRYKSSYVSHGVDRDAKTETYWLNLTQAPEKSVIQELSGAPFNTIISWGFSLNQEQTEEATWALTTAAEVSEQVEGFRIGPVASPRVQQIEVQLDVLPGLDVDTVAKTLFESPEFSHLNASPDAIPVVIVEGEDLSFTEATDVKGGHAVPSCTTGFTANWSGQPGAITAGHCSSMSIYDGVSGVFETFGRPSNPTYGSANGTLDVRFGTTIGNNATTKIFRDSFSSELTVTGVGTPAVGMSICKFGLETGRNCGGGDPLYITNVGFCAQSGGSGTRCGLSSTNRNVVVQGDSGGPWFSGQGAYGITTGFVTGSSYLTGATAIQTVGITIRQN